MFKRKAFLHWYTGEGMDESELGSALGLLLLHLLLLHTTPALLYADHSDRLPCLL